MTKLQELKAAYDAAYVAKADHRAAWDAYVAARAAYAAAYVAAEGE